MDVFAACHSINDLLIAGDENSARDELIRLLDALKDERVDEYSELVNSLIRDVGLFPYLQSETSSWEERFVKEVFTKDIGGGQKGTLHREQSRLLTALLDGKSVAVSAPTSFGKSFVIDSFISIKEPSNVVILVPTIALADETRRRLQKKFGKRYKIITTADQSVAEANIFVFPQERVASYMDSLGEIDILIVDEFYKASRDYDKERSPALIKAIIELSKVAKQRYFLAPNIDGLDENPFTEGMEFLRIDFNTVVLDKVDLSAVIAKDDTKKNAALLGILDNTSGKTLVYAGTYANVTRIGNLLMETLPDSNNNLPVQFKSWLEKNYEPNWALTKLAGKGVGFHNGRLHRSLSQIQVKLFEEPNGLDQLVSTSSMIEGVNTSAENVVLWSNKNGRAKINDFTYKNIIGRGGRMFRHFVGKIYILEEPPVEKSNQLELAYPEELLGTFDEAEYEMKLTQDQVGAIEKFKSEMTQLVGAENMEYFRQADVLQSNDSSLVLKIATELAQNGTGWNGLANLNSSEPSRWENYLYKLLNLQPGSIGIQYSKYVKFVQVLSHNWRMEIPDLLDALNRYDISLDNLFELERNTTFKLATLLGDVSTIYNKMYPTQSVDLSLALSRFSNAFLPVAVFQLEEYGLPRMISRKIQNSSLINLENPEDNVHDVIEKFREIGIDRLLNEVKGLEGFDQYVLQYFFDGI